MAVVCWTFAVVVDGGVAPCSGAGQTEDNQVGGHGDHTQGPADGTPVEVKSSLVLRTDGEDRVLLAKEFVARSNTIVSWEVILALLVVSESTGESSSKIADRNSSEQKSKDTDDNEEGILTTIVTAAAADEEAEAGDDSTQQGHHRQTVPDIEDIRHMLVIVATPRIRVAFIAHKVLQNVPRRVPEFGTVVSQDAGLSSPTSQFNDGAAGQSSPISSFFFINLCRPHKGVPWTSNRSYEKNNKTDVPESTTAIAPTHVDLNKIS